MKKAQKKRALKIRSGVKAGPVTYPTPAGWRPGDDRLAFPDVHGWYPDVNGW